MTSAEKTEEPELVIMIIEFVLNYSVTPPTTRVVMRTDQLLRALHVDPIKYGLMVNVHQKHHHTTVGKITKLSQKISLMMLNLLLKLQLLCG